MRTTSALRLLQSADALRARLAGMFSAVHGLSVNEYFLLMQLARSPGKKMSRVELSRRLHISASTVTRMVAPMEKTGWLDRETGHRDARLTLVVLTDAGAELLAAARQTFEAEAREFFEDRWAEPELEQLADLLGRLTAGVPARLT